MTLFKNATVVDFAPPAVRPGLDVLVNGGTVAKVGTGLRLPVAGGGNAERAVAPSADTANAGRTIDATGKLLFPGLVCSHHHMYSGLSRGIMANIGPTPDFVSILRNLWWRLDRALDRESLASSGLICCLDAIRCGTTAAIDHHASPAFISGSLAVLKDAYEITGLRGATCYEVTDRHGRDDMIAGIEENADFARTLDVEKAAGTWSGLMEAHIGGHAPVTLPDEALERIAAVCTEAGRGFHVHLAEDRYDVSHSHATYGSDIVPRLDAFGLLNDKTILVHGVHLSASEIDLVNERDSFLVHNARSNMNNNVGYTHMIPRVKNLAIGTDGIGADMIAELQSAYFKHKDEGGAWWPGDFLAALGGGYRLLERVFGGKFGRVEPGYAADLVMADYASPTPLEPENIAGHMVFGMGSGMVESVMVGGKMVMEERTFPLDTAAIYEEARGQAKRVWERMDTIDP